MSGFTIGLTSDGRLRTHGLDEAGLADLSTRDPGHSRRAAARVLLTRIAAYQVSMNHRLTAGEPMVDSDGVILKTQLAGDGTLEVFPVLH